MMGYAREILFVPGQPPECNCTTCVNKRLPCRYFVAVCNLLHINPKQECYLHPHWRLRRHPVFREALRNLSLLPADHGLPALSQVAPVHATHIEAATVSEGVVEYGGTFSVPREQYDKIIFPKELYRRHNDLNTLANEVVTLGKHGEHQFKIAMAALAATKVKLMAGHQDTTTSAGDAEQRGIILPPAGKAGRKIDADAAQTMQVNNACLPSVYSQLQSVTVCYSRLQSVYRQFSTVPWRARASLSMQILNAIRGKSKGAEQRQGAGTKQVHKCTHCAAHGEVSTACRRSSAKCKYST
jgi:hypothetical protein